MSEPVKRELSSSGPDAREVVEEFLLLQRVAERINSMLDLDALLDQIVRDVEQTFGYCRSATLLKDEETDELVITHGWTGDRIHVGDRFAVGGSGIAGHVGKTQQTHYAPNVLADPYYEIGHVSTRSELDIPLKVRGRFIGVFNLQHTSIDAFSPSRIQLLEALAGHVATAIDNARMFQNERLEKERVLYELKEAETIQTSLLPFGAPDLQSFVLTGVCHPCRSVGGDWFDYVPLADGRLAVVLADVSGKGMGAALLMSSTRSILRLTARDGSPPADVLGRLNEILLEDFPAARFVTMVYAIIDPAKRTLSFANAGHPPPLFVDEAGPVFLETDAGLPLGIARGNYTSRTVTMKPGNRFVLYSDGVTEAFNASEEEYGLERIQEHFRGPRSSVHTLLEDVRTFSIASPLSDDVTVVMLAADS